MRVDGQWNPCVCEGGRGGLIHSGLNSIQKSLLIVAHNKNPMKSMKIAAFAAVIPKVDIHFSAKLFAICQYNLPQYRT